MGLFGSSGIRGIVNEQMTPELALKAGKALGSIKKRVVVGRDPRTSGQMVENAFIAGLLASGADAVRIGVVSTPTLAYAARDYDCGIMVTASHNPPEYNGLKFWNPDGMAFSLVQQDEMEMLIEKGVKGADWKAMGSDIQRQDAIANHIHAILAHVKHSSLKVVVDCGCGAGSTITPYVLRDMGCHVISLNAQPDGFFPARMPEPVEENLTQLKEAVKANGADLGIAHDGDADRMVAVDDLGRFVSGDALLAYFCKYEVRHALVCPVDVSMIVDSVLNGAKIYRTKIGDAFVSEEARRVNAEFGGETSGTWIFPRISYCPDGIYAAARLVELVGEHGKLSGSIDSLPRYPLKRGGIHYESGMDKKAIMQNIKAQLEGTGYGDLNTLDGLRVSYADGWILIRPSGTEPKIRITAEAENADRLEKLYAQAESLVKRSVAACKQ